MWRAFKPKVVKALQGAASKVQSPLTLEGLSNATSWKTAKSSAFLQDFRGLWGFQIFGLGHHLSMSPNWKGRCCQSMASDKHRSLGSLNVICTSKQAARPVSCHIASVRVSALEESFFRFKVTEHCSGGTLSHPRACLPANDNKWNSARNFDVVLTFPARLWPRQDRILQRQFFAEQECAMLVRHMLEASAASSFSALKRLNIGMQTFCALTFRSLVAASDSEAQLDSKGWHELIRIAAFKCSELQSFAQTVQALQRAGLYHGHLSPDCFRQLGRKPRSRYFDLDQT